MAKKKDKTAEALERRTEALERIGQWADAYPLEIFHQPDIAKANAILQEHGMTVDAISAKAMRFVLEGVRKIVRDALGA